jgi:hypothetical protein
MGRNREVIGASGVLRGGEFRTVALAREVEKHNVVARGDGVHGAGGLLIGEVSSSPHDALLEERRPRRGKLEVWAVVGFDGEDIDTGEMSDEIIGHSAEIGGEAERASRGSE